MHMEQKQKYILSLSQPNNVPIVLHLNSIENKFHSENKNEDK
jgi:hypothetical protein